MPVGRIPVAAELIVTPPLVKQQWLAAMDPWLRTVLHQRSDAGRPSVSAAEWQAWQRAMAEHGLLPLLHKWLKDCPDSLRPPTPVMDVLQQAYLQQAALVAVRHRQLACLMTTLAEAKQPALVLKGAAVAESLYPDPAQRPATDIDVLVRPLDYPKAREALLAAGYHSRKGRRPNQADWAGEEEFVMPGVPNWFMVDLHWTLSPFTWTEQPETLEMLFHEAHLIEAGDISIPVLVPSHALVHAALHLIYANFDNIRLIWVYDLHLLSRQVDDQGLWPDVFAVARQWHGRLALADALLLAQHWFGTPLPPGLTDPDHFSAHEAEWAVYQTVHSAASTPEKMQRLRLANLSYGQRLSFYYDRLLPNSQEIDLNYPRFRKWPYPLKAIGRLATILAGQSKRD
jgi:hypothetical protein